MFGHTLSTGTVTVASGFSAVTVRPVTSGPVSAGTNADLVVSAESDVTDPGTVRVPTQLGSAIWVTSADGCTVDATDWLCTVAGATTAVLHVAVSPSASGTQVLTVYDAGSRPFAASVEVTALDPSGPIALTGPFGGTQIGSDVLRCTTPKIQDRGQCRDAGPDGGAGPRSGGHPVPGRSTGLGRPHLGHRGAQQRRRRRRRRRRHPVSGLLGHPGRALRQGQPADHQHRSDQLQR